MQCCGTMTFWRGSGSGYPYLGLFSCYFRHWPSRCQQKPNSLTQFFSACYFLKVHLHHFSKIKSQKESQNSRNQGFSYYFCVIIEGSGSESGSIPLTSGSGSGSWRPKNMWIRIRIRNTGDRISFARDFEVNILHSTKCRLFSLRIRVWLVSVLLRLIGPGYRT